MKNYSYRKHSKVDANTPRENRAHRDSKPGRQHWATVSFGDSVGGPLLFGSRAKRDEHGHTTACGKTAYRVTATRRMNSVTCPLCRDWLKENEWYCPEHGFLDGKDVTFEETCDYCGESVGGGDPNVQTTEETEKETIRT